MDPLIALTIAWSFAALCGAAAIHQWRARDEWHGIVGNYRLVPDAWVSATAIAIPLLEFTAALALPWQRTRGLGALVAALLLVVFALALSINIGRGRTHIDCGCLGSSLRTGLSRWMVVRNLVLAALVSTLLLPVLPRALSLFELVMSAGSVITLAFLYAALGLLLSTRAGWQRVS